MFIVKKKIESMLDLSYKEYLKKAKKPEMKLWYILCLLQSNVDIEVVDKYLKELGEKFNGSKPTEDDASKTCID